jgi:hypothetical protein
MKYFKIFVLVFFSLAFFSCIDEEGAYLMPASDAKVESRAALLGKWNLTEISYKSEKSTGVIGENADAAFITFNENETFLAHFKNSVFNGTWKVSPEMNAVVITVPDEQRPTFIAHIPKNWAIMKSDAGNLWLDTGEHAIKLAK